MPQPLIACCDLGATKMLVGLVTLQGELVATEKYFVGQRIQPAHVIADLDRAIQRLLAQQGQSLADVVALGCSSTGTLNTQQGIVSMNHNMGWVDVPFRGLLAEHFPFPVVLEMDANAAALGEWWRGQARGLDSFAFVIVGSGIGSGLIVNGQVVHGAHGAAGEIGHTILIPDGPLCGCGKHGCLEALSSGMTVASKASAAIKLGRETGLSHVQGPLTALHVAEAARNGDSVAREILDDAAYYLGLGLSNLITVFDPQMIVIGGGFGTGAFDLMQAPLQRGLQKHLNYWAARETPVVASALGEHAGLMGAARAALGLLSNSHTSEVIQ